MTTNISRRRFIRLAGTGAALVGGATALGGLAGCGDDSPSDDPADAPDKGQPYSGQLSVSHLDFSMGGPVLYSARDKGIFAKHDLELELINSGGGSSSLQVIQTNTGIGIAAPISAMAAQSRGVTTFRAIGGLINGQTTNWLSKKDQPNPFDDLKGKTIACPSPDSIATYFARRLTKDRGLDSNSDVKITYVAEASGAATAVERGVVDVGWSALPFSETQKDDLAVVYSNSELIPRWVDNQVIATEQHLAEHPDATRRILLALKEAIEFVHNTPDEAAAIWAEHTGLPEDVALNVLREHGDILNLSIDREGLDSVAEAAKVGGFVEKDVDVDALIDDGYLPGGVTA